MSSETDQLGFDALLADAESENRTWAFDRETAHLPTTMAEAIPFYRQQIEAHHAAMLICDFDAAMAIREEAHLVARKLNGGQPGILAHDNAPGYVLARETAAAANTVPLWGQDGDFVTDAAGMRLRVKMHGIFGIGATAMPYLSFELRAVDNDKLFLSETGYRSFLGVSLEPRPGRTTEDFMRGVVELHVARELNGRLVEIAPRWRGSGDG